MDKIYKLIKWLKLKLPCYLNLLITSCQSIYVILKILRPVNVRCLGFSWHCWWQCCFSGLWHCVNSWESTNILEKYTVSIFRAEDGDSMFLWNVSIYLWVYTVLQPRRTSSLRPVECILHTEKVCETHQITVEACSIVLDCAGYPDSNMK
jgi:hypothetical protein